MSPDEALGLHGVRFAPSPTGSFHVGNLRTAWLSCKIAELLAQTWVVRIEDIDKARVKEDSWSDPYTGQLADMNKLGLFPGQLVRQSEHHARHEKLFRKAIAEDKIYPCDCSRSDVRAALASFASAPHEREPQYSGRCRHADKSRTLNPVETIAWRWKTDEPSGHFDAVIARTRLDGSEFQPGYHFACAVDDADGAYRLLVRAWDLAPAEEIQKQIRLWVSPQKATPVFHCALVTQENGNRLEKRTKGITLAELKLAGIAPTDLIEKFADSANVQQIVSDILAWEKSAASQTNALLGEARKTIALSELSIRT